MAKGKLTPAQEKFVEKFFGKKVDEFSKEKNITKANRFCGTTVQVDELTAKTIDLVFKIENGMQMGDAALQRINPELKRSNAVQNFDRARMLVLALDSDAYMAILD